MGTVAFALATLLAVVLFWAGVRAVVFHGRIVEVFIGGLMASIAIAIVVILYLIGAPS
jgi:hypothetical protein